MAQNENWESSIHLENFHSSGETLLINLRGFRRTLWKNIKQAWVKNKYETSNVGAKIICVLCNIDLEMLITFKQKN